MTTLHGRRAEQGLLQHAEGLALIGPMAGTGYREPPFLVRRGDGQMLQLTPLLYRTLELVGDHHDAEAVAAALTQSEARLVTAENVQSLVDDQLRPLGLLTRADGSQPELKRSDPLLGLRLRVRITDPVWTRRVTRPFTVLFRPGVVLPVVAAFALVCWWVFFEKGLAAAAYDAFQHPGLLIFVFVVTLLSAGFHEFGHAAAARYGGATPGVMGAGVYLAWPAFYTDVTDSYRLDRRGRLRTDLGGLYFNAIVAVGITAAWLLTGYDALLLVVATQILQMIGQLMPLVRFDGYHVLADLAGVPDLFRRIKPTLLGALPWRWGDPEAKLLKPWARVLVTAWVILVVPLLAMTLYVIVLALPRILATAWAAIADEQDLFAEAWSSGDMVQATARGITMLAVAIPVLAILVMLGRFAGQLARTVWRRTSGRPVKRSISLALAGVLAAGLAWAWWPDGRTYRPIEPDETGTLVDALAAGEASRAAPSIAGGEALEPGSEGVVGAVWDTSQAMPDAGSPQLALVLVPKGSPDGELSEGWVFPFDRPLAPGPGDNQALAVNTEDGTVEYDVAIAMVWVTDDDPVLNTNEAYAFASCTSCAAVAVAFQVVVVVGDNPTVVPQNLAGALNSDCVNCLTYALAQQLLVTVAEPLSPEAMAALDALWAELAEYAENIESQPLDEIDDQLDEFAAEILAIIEADQPGTVPTTAPTPTDSVTTDPSAVPSPTGEPSPTSSGAATPEPSPTSDASETPSDAPTVSPSPSDSVTP